MNIELLPHQGLSPQAYAALKDAARYRAVEQRRQAVRDFGVAIARGLHALWRALRGRANAAPASYTMEA